MRGEVSSEVSDFFTVDTRYGFNFGSGLSGFFTVDTRHAGWSGEGYSAFFTVDTRGETTGVGFGLTGLFTVDTRYGLNLGSGLSGFFTVDTRHAGWSGDGYSAFFTVDTRGATPDVGLWIAGLFILEGYAGPTGNGGGTRPVIFTATDASGKPLAIWNESLTFAGGVAPYTLTNVPAGTANLSAKTDWNLRKRLPVAFGPCAATVSFTGPNALPAGDLDNSNVVDIQDYYRLAAAWYQPNEAADLDGSGLVDLDDYFLLVSRWSMQGDPE